ncbi:MAG: hypothetical protein AAB425_15860 [Bdellovibrionota bacterium]|mgnify:CR=1 FL=1
MNCDSALFQGKIRGVAAVFHENERPLHGLAGWLDWRFHSGLSRFLAAGQLAGKPGECAYLPFERHGTTYHVLLIGAGKTEVAGRRNPVPPESILALRKNLASLRLGPVGISQTDFGNVPEKNLLQLFKGTEVWIGE